MGKRSARSQSAAVAFDNDLTLKDIGKIANEQRREKCADDLALFGITYCGIVLKHQPSEKMVTLYITKLAECVRRGGQFVVEFPRGAGKTTWVKIALVWAILYGYRRFPVAFAANAKLAKGIIRDVWSIVERSPMILQDFPAASRPISHIRGVFQRCPAQTFEGEPTGIDLKSDHLVFANLIHPKTGKPLDKACGARLMAFGLGSGFKGISEMGERPDLVFFDDPQTRKDAGSPTSVNRLDDKIHGDALGLAGHDSDIAALCAITPILPGDLADKLTSKSDHPEWSASVVPLVSQWGNAEKLIDGFIEAYRVDASNDDFSRTTSRKFYEEHAREFASMDVLDPLNYSKSEFDAKHHVLNLIAKSGMDNFRAEYQLQTRDISEGEILKPEEIATHVSGVPQFTLPQGCTDAVAFCDVNVKAASGLRMTILGVGPNRVTSVIAYARYPQQGRLYDESASDVEKRNKLVEAITQIYRIVASAPIHRAGSNRQVSVRALCFDGGWEQTTVARTVELIKSRLRPRFPVMWARGYGWKKFFDRESRAMRGDHMFESVSKDGAYIAIQADYWREIAQNSWRALPGTPGSVSLFGTDGRHHYATGYTLEICGEHLSRTFIAPDGRKGWEWIKTGDNHWGDTLSGCFALASWMRLYDAISISVSSQSTDESKSIVAMKNADTIRRVSAHRRKRIVIR